MSWDADLTAYADGNPICVGDWKYTHNTSRMIYAVWSEEDQRRATARKREWYAAQPDPKWRDPLLARIDAGELSGSWYEALHGLSGADGAEFLGRIVAALEAEPERFRAMNPDNGWGSYESLLAVLREMRDQSAKFPTADWSCSG